MRGIIFTEVAAERLLVGRTDRSLRACGLTNILRAPADQLPELLEKISEPVWLLRAGSWQARRSPIREIPASATGKALIGLGHGGDSYYLTPPAARALAVQLRGNSSVEAAMRKVAGQSQFRAVPLHDIDVTFDPSPRVFALTTSIQIGGAERVAMDLAHEFNRAGWQTALVAIGSPTRRAFTAPSSFINLSSAGLAPENRADAVLNAALNFGADVIHAHLIRTDEAEAIRARGLPLAITVHNAFPIWPEGYAEARAPFADLFLGCAEAVTREIEARISTAAFTVWNGIDPSRSEPTPDRAAAAVHLRNQLGWSATDFVILNIANARPQKRLHRLPEIVARLQTLLAPRPVRLLLAGEPATSNPVAQECMDALHAETKRWDVRNAVHWTGAMDDVAPLLATADVLLAVSEHEGLSLAQLEALAAGLPVVATDAGGTREIAAQSSRFSLIPVDATAEAFANELAKIANDPPSRMSELPADFTRFAMAARTRQLLHSFLASRAQDSRGESAWLITNNFTTGGAQSSARRLLEGLQRAGHPVRAAVLEESESTHGSRSLRSNGVPVHEIAPRRDAAAMVADLLAEMSAHPPRAVLFWNVMPPVKILLAELLALWRRSDGSAIPVFDVSPGEMLFQSLTRFLDAKPAGWPVSTARDYGRRLAGMVVKYAGETERAALELGTKVHVISNGIPRSESVPRLPSRTFVIGTVARLSPDKRLDQLLEAFRLALPRLAQCRLEIAGGPDGDNKAHVAILRQQARGLPVQWLGDIRDIPGFLRNVDLFAMISEPAGCPNASLEAMAAGLAVVATDHGGASEQVIDSVTGRLVPRGDVQAFADALVELANDTDRRGTLARQAQTHVRDRFSMEKMIEGYLSLINGTQ